MWCTHGAVEVIHDLLREDEVLVRVDVSTGAPMDEAVELHRRAHSSTQRYLK